jgi:hypothetical protein
MGSGKIIIFQNYTVTRHFEGNFNYTFYLILPLRGQGRQWPKGSTPTQCWAVPLGNKSLSFPCRGCCERTMSWEACWPTRTVVASTRTLPSKCQTTIGTPSPLSLRSASDPCSGKSSGPRPSWLWSHNLSFQIMCHITLNLFSELFLSCLLIN